jgi:Ca2+-binding RTX toxin-like protein
MTVALIPGTNSDDTLAGTASDDTIDGKHGKDQMSGGDGNDTYYVDNIGDTVFETMTGGLDTVISSVPLTSGFSYVENYIFKTASDVHFTADGQGNYVSSGSGNDVIDVGDGYNFAYGNAGNDTLIGGKGDDQLHGGSGDDIINGGDAVGSNQLYGDGGNDQLLGGNALDLLDGGSGADSMAGGDGDDSYVIDNAGDSVTEQGTPGAGNHDTVNSYISIGQLWANVEDANLLGSAALNLTGNDLNNTLQGNKGANVIDGGAGADTMRGGAGNDIYIVDNIGDVVNEIGKNGIDLVKSSVGFDLSKPLAAGVENLLLTGNGNIDATGNALANVLTGNDGNNRLDGGSGSDTLIGGKGDDIYVVDSAGDKVVESISNANGGGHDRVESSISYSITALGNIEDITLTGSGSINAKGNGLDNTLIGGNGSNILDGGAGADVMAGGGGHDTYYVDNLGDQVIEKDSEGTDTVISGVALSDAIAYVENYIFNTKTGVHFTGSADNNSITGSTHDDVLDGGDGSDFLDGGAGNDTLVGGIGNDSLVGGTGADAMSGGDGDDSYFVDNATDTVVEVQGEGAHDFVSSKVSITKLWDNVEDAALEGSAALNLTGNNLNNTLTGNDGANIIDGGLGADTMHGGKGNDTYIVDDVADIVSEQPGEGTDLVKSSVSFALGSDIENLTLTSSGDLTGIGNGANNVITGNDGANTLVGGGGEDTLIGGKGDDAYFIDSLGDKVVETIANGGGHDTVYSTISFSLSGLGNVEDLILQGGADSDATGNAADNLLQGNAGANHLDGGAGADVMKGLDGNDTYHIDNIGDVVVEKFGEGIDTVISKIALSGPIANVENYTFNIGKAVDFAGDGADNVIHGGSGNDILHGGGGHDSLYGGAGDDSIVGGSLADLIDGGTGADKMAGGGNDDVYFVDSAGDTILELFNDGSDTVFSMVSVSLLWDNVENLGLLGKGALNVTGNDLDNVLGGNDAANKMDGGIGKDFLYGHAGNDTLTGGSGADTFHFELAGGAKTNDGHDTITDFLKAEDILSFDVGDVDNNNAIDINDLLADVKSVVDHGAGRAVDVFFNNGSEITFTGCGTGSVSSLDDLVSNPATQIHVS